MVLLEDKTMKIPAQTAVVDDLQNVLTRGPSTRLFTSAELDWRGILVERHRIPPGEKPEVETDSYVVKLAAGQGIAYGERQDRTGTFMPYSKHPGSIYVFPPGVLPRIHTSVETELLIAILEKDFVEEIAEQRVENLLGTEAQLELHDASMKNILNSLEEEGESGGISGSLYVNHLTHAFVLRLLSLLPGRADIPKREQNGLPRPRLRRVLERIETNLQMNLDLQTLADESGYSKNHFLRMFRVATGYTPYQYLLHSRVRRAQGMLRDKSIQLVDIALACGFSSHAQLSRVFRQVTGVSPSEYRRNL
jgi:AraC family transcriptional regulator